MVQYYCFILYPQCYILLESSTLFIFIFYSYFRNLFLVCFNSLHRVQFKDLGGAYPFLSLGVHIYKELVTLQSLFYILDQGCISSTFQSLVFMRRNLFRFLRSRCISLEIQYTSFNCQSLWKININLLFLFMIKNILIDLQNDFGK